MTRICAVAIAALLVIPGAAAAEVPVEVTASPLANDNGKHLDVSIAWSGLPPDGSWVVVLRRPASVAAAPLPDRFGDKLPDVNAPAAEGSPWSLAFASAMDPDKNTASFTDEIAPGTPHVYAVVRAIKHDGVGDAPGHWQVTPLAESRPAEARAAVYNTTRTFFLLIIALTGAAFLLYLRYAKKHAADIFIRRIPGVDAIEDAIGRSTEMGRPIMYVTGIEEIQDIQTIASILILGHVAHMTADYDTEIKVCNTYPMTMVIAEEVVRQGYANAGRLDAHRPENVMFITSEQFAFAAAVNGMILRDRPATNIYFGRFFAESLMLAETGYLTGAVQIAGTAEFSQLPFFIAACDYTLIGEELYAVGAYLSREPTLLAQLKAGDVVKLVSMALIVVGMVLATTEVFRLGPWLMP
jgi:hypothetical protein